MPPVYDQGQLGSCTANAIGAAFEFDQRQGGLQGLHALAAVHLLQRARDGGDDRHRQRRDDPRRDEERRQARRLRRGHLAVRHLEVHGEAADARPTPRRRSTRRCSTSGSFRCCTSCRAALPPGYPFVFGFSVYESFMSPEVAKTGEVPLPAAERAADRRPRGRGRRLRRQRSSASSCATRGARAGARRATARCPTAT